MNVSNFRWTKPSPEWRLPFVLLACRLKQRDAGDVAKTALRWKATASWEFVIEGRRECGSNWAALNWSSRKTEDCRGCKEAGQHVNTDGQLFECEVSAFSASALPVCCCFVFRLLNWWINWWSVPFPSPCFVQLGCTFNHGYERQRGDIDNCRGWGHGSYCNGLFFCLSAHCKGRDAGSELPVILLVAGLILRVVQKTRRCGRYGLKDGDFKFVQCQLFLSFARCWVYLF